MVKNVICGWYYDHKGKKDVFLDANQYETHVKKHFEPSFSDRKGNPSVFVKLENSTFSQMIFEAINKGSCQIQMKRGKKFMLYCHNFGFKIGVHGYSKQTCKKCMIVCIPKRSFYEIFTIYPAP